MSDSDSESSDSLPVGKGALWAKWGRFGVRNNILAASEPVTLNAEKEDGVDDAVGYCVDSIGARYVYVYTGVHGGGWGEITFNEPDFLEADVKQLEQDDKELTVTIRRMTVEDGARSLPIRLWNDVHQRDACVVLAWCYSRYYYDRNKAQFDSSTPPAASITVPPRTGPLRLARGGFALPARKIGGRRYRRPK